MMPPPLRTAIRILQDEDFFCVVYHFRNLVKLKTTKLKAEASASESRFESGTETSKSKKYFFIIGLAVYRDCAFMFAMNC